MRSIAQDWRLRASARSTWKSPASTPSPTYPPARLGGPPVLTRLAGPNSSGASPAPLSERPSQHQVHRRLSWFADVRGLLNPSDLHLTCMLEDAKGRNNQNDTKADFEHSRRHNADQQPTDDCTND